MHQGKMVLSFHSYSWRILPPMVVLERICWHLFVILMSLSKNGNRLPKTVPNLNQNGSQHHHHHHHYHRITRLVSRLKFPPIDNRYYITSQVMEAHDTVQLLNPLETCIFFYVKTIFDFDLRLASLARYHRRKLLSRTGNGNQFPRRTKGR